MVFPFNLFRRKSAAAKPVEVEDRSQVVSIAQMFTIFSQHPNGLSVDSFGGREAAATLRASLETQLTAQGIPGLPPEHMQRRVVGAYVPQFLNSGYATLRQFDYVLSRKRKNLADFNRVLDFGCGCGRNLRALAETQKHTKIFGADIDAEAIAWLSANYKRFGRFVVLPHRPPSEFRDRFFDLIFGVSVFTHLPEDMQFEWLAELNRIARRGAHLLLSVHGDNYFSKLSPEIRPKAEAHGFYFSTETADTDGLPSFYKNSYHTKRYVLEKWSRYFEILDYYPLGLDNHQDLVHCRKRRE